ncbi:hypothetical protein MMC21_001717 [Puttea exsequens]|nr:hypothetical protein [Puttea exsequens]
MTVAGASPSSPNPEIDHEDDYIDVEAGPTNDHAVAADEPARKLSPRQIWMITCGGITGIGLVFSTSKTLAGTSPATMLIGYLVLSIAWDFSDIALKPSLEKHIEKVHDEISPEIAKAFIAFVDFLGFLGFLALLVTNGIMIRDLGKGYYHYYGPPNDKIMALTYNSVPWIICAACHLLIFLFIIGGFLPADKFPKIKIEWPEAANAWDGLTGHANDGADAPLLHNEDTGEHDEEA